MRCDLVDVHANRSLHLTNVILMVLSCSGLVLLYLYFNPCPRPAYIICASL